MSLGVLTVGLGSIGMGYDLLLDSKYVMTHARAAKQNNKYHLLGGVDPSHNQRALFELEYGAPAFMTIEDALSVVKPELIVIAVPTSNHLDLIQRALSRCIPKVVLCEKPLAYTVAEAKEIVKLCEDKKVALYVNYMRRSDPGVIEIKRRIEEKEIVAPFKGFLWYSKGFLHNGSHFFNLLNYWLGAMQDVRVIDVAECSDESDMALDIFIKFELGEVCFLSRPAENFPLYALELVASNGRLRYDQAGREIAWESTTNDKLFSGEESLSSNMEYIDNQIHQFQYNVFEQIACALEGKPAFLSTGSDALNTVQQLVDIMDIARK